MSVTHLITYIVPNRVVGLGQVSAEYPSWVTKPIGVTKPSSWVDPHLNSPLLYYNLYNERLQRWTILQERCYPDYPDSPVPHSHILTFPHDPFSSLSASKWRIGSELVCVWGDRRKIKMKSVWSATNLYTSPCLVGATNNSKNVFPWQERQLFKHTRYVKASTPLYLPSILIHPALEKYPLELYPRSFNSDSAIQPLEPIYTSYL